MDGRVADWAGGDRAGAGDKGGAQGEGPKSNCSFTWAPAMHIVVEIPPVGSGGMSSGRAGQLRLE